MGDAKAYAQTLKTNKIYTSFHNRIKAQEQSGCDNDVDMKRSPQMVLNAKKYLLNHYHRTFGDKLQSKGDKEPDYIRDFKYEKGIDVMAKLKALKKYGYSQKIED